MFFFSLWTAFGWGVLYLTFSALPLVYGTVYNFNIQQIGAVSAGKLEIFLVVKSIISKCESVETTVIAVDIG